MRWTNQGFFDHEGHAIEFQSTGSDISERKAAEEQLARYQENLEHLVEERTKQEQYQRKIAESLQEIAAALNSSLDREVVLKKILEQLERVILYDGAALYLVEGEDLQVMDARGSSQKMIGNRISVEALRYPLHDVFFEGAPRVIAVNTEDPKWSNVSEPDSTKSWLGTPLIAGDRVIGVLSVESDSPEKYSDSDLHVVQAFANHAALAVVNAELHRKAQIAAVTEERNRIARDLHDAVTQSIFSASLIAEALPLQWEQDEAGARQNLAKLHRLTRSALAEMRMLLLELRPVSLQQIRLATLIDNLREAYQIQIGVSIDLKVTDQNVGVLPFDVKEYFYRVTQEALNNVAKHAAASQVHIQLEQGENAVRLCIQDNGQGFDPDQVASDHLGLQIMRERAAKVNARLTIESGPDKGTLIRTEWKKNHE
jgi:two-component system nitrate/nitrite sensor histidine kinase NarX